MRDVLPYLRPAGTASQIADEHATLSSAVCRQATAVLRRFQDHRAAWRFQSNSTQRYVPRWTVDRVGGVATCAPDGGAKAGAEHSACMASGMELWRRPGTVPWIFPRGDLPRENRWQGLNHGGRYVVRPLPAPPPRARRPAKPFVAYTVPPSLASSPSLKRVLSAASRKSLVSRPERRSLALGQMPSPMFGESSSPGKSPVALSTPAASTQHKKSLITRTQGAGTLSASIIFSNHDVPALKTDHEEGPHPAQCSAIRITLALT
jgi:hypothetical protein